MGVSRRLVVRSALGLLAVLALAALIDGGRLWRTHTLNAAIATAQVRDGPDDAPPELRFAVAHAMAASGSADAALDRYRSLQGDSPLGQAARYNLERAQRLWPDPEDAESEPAEARRNAERAATTMRGYSPGLP